MYSPPVEGSLSQDYKGITLRQLFVPHFPPFYRHDCVHTSILDRPRHIRSFLTTRRARSGKSSYQNHTPLETAIWRFPNSALARPWMSLDPRTCFFSINDGYGSFESPKVNSMRYKSTVQVSVSRGVRFWWILAPAQIFPP